jgi:hypothetical protein
LSGDEVFCRTSEQLGQPWAVAMASRKLLWILFPHGETTVEAFAALLLEGMQTKSLEMVWFGHGNSLEVNKQIPVDE